jgi:ferric-dicitrate binding protein FerR (iron transport regulator)
MQRSKNNSRGGGGVDENPGVIKVRLAHHLMKTDEYYLLIQKWLSGSSTAEENLAIQSWLSLDRENKKEFDEIRENWKESENGVDEMTDEQFNAGLIQLERNVTASIQKERGLKRIRNFAALFFFANVIFTTATIYIFTASRNNFYDRRNGVVKVDEQQITLSDGSTVNVKKGQFISSFNDSTRDVQLAGEAYFNVTKDIRPFVINLNQAFIKVKGTSFLVETHPEGFDVFVREGTVQVFKNKTQWDVGAGKHFKIYGNSSPEISIIHALNFDSWYTRKLQFKNASLQQVVSELEMFYEIKCKLQPSLSNCNFTGTLNNVPLSEAIRVLCYSMNIEFNIDRDGIYEIVGKPCHT